MASLLCQYMFGAENMYLPDCLTIDKASSILFALNNRMKISPEIYGF